MVRGSEIREQDRYRPSLGDSESEEHSEDSGKERERERKREREHEHDRKGKRKSSDSTRSRRSSGLGSYSTKSSRKRNADALRGFFPPRSTSSDSRGREASASRGRRGERSPSRQRSRSQDFDHRSSRQEPAIFSVAAPQAARHDAPSNQEENLELFVRNHCVAGVDVEERQSMFMVIPRSQDYATFQELLHRTFGLHVQQKIHLKFEWNKLKITVISEESWEGCKLRLQTDEVLEVHGRF